MTQIRARILVGRDHRISGTVPDDVPPGEHEALITLAPPPEVQPSPERLHLAEMPVHDLGPWPEGLSLRREDIYGDDGR